MKKLIILLLLAMAAPTLAQILTQNHFRWRNDDGSETTATWRADEDDTTATVMQNTKIRLRVEIYRDQPGSNIQFSLWYHTDRDVQPAWLAGTQLSADGSVNHFQLASTTWYDQDDNATDQLTTTPGYTHALGWCHETELYRTFSIADKADVEIEFCIMPTSNATLDTDYFFTVRWNSGIGYDVYERLPKIKVVENSLPVELISFQAKPDPEGVKLAWSTASEENNLGFILERRYNEQSPWQRVASYRTHPELLGQDTKTTTTHYTYTDTPRRNAGQVWYRLSNVDRDGTVEIKSKVAVNLQSATPFTFGMEPAYPNPFNPATTIPYHLEESAHVQLSIYDILGRLLTTLVDQPGAAAGQYTVTWDGTDAHGMTAPGGLYFVQLRAGNRTDVQKVILLD